MVNKSTVLRRHLLAGLNSRFLRFSLVGGTGTIVNLGTLAILHEVFGMRPNIALLVAIEVSIVFNYFANHYYTFRAQHKSGHKLSLMSFLKFNTGTLIGACISYGSFFALYNYVGIYYLIADALGIIAALAWNYWISIRYVWALFGTEPTKRQ